VRRRLTRLSREVSILVGGVSELFQGDLDLGRLAAARLQCEHLGSDVLVEDFHYGAVAVAQRLAEVRPDVLVLIGAVRRGRTPGCVERRRIDQPQLSPADLQAAVGDAVTGYVHVDLVVDIAAGLGALPSRTVVMEVEPQVVAPGEGLSSAAAAGLERGLELVRAEVGRAPLLALADDLRPLVAGSRLEDSAAVHLVRCLLDELVRLDREGRWGHAFTLRDRLRLSIAAGGTGEGMDHRDWGLWWALIEELDRLEAAEAVPPALSS